MATVGNANIDITANTSQADGAIRGFMGSLRGIGSVAAGVVGGLAIFETITAGLRGVWEHGIMANASMEQYQNTLTVVQGSSEKAAATLDWVKNFAASTPFEIPGLVEATVAMESYGLTAQEWLPLAGDMAAVMGKDIMQATEAIADAQTGELERLKEFGVTKDQIIAYGQEMRMAAFVNAKGQITDQAAFNQALQGLMKERFEGGMAIQATSFKGLISNAKDSMGQLLTTMTQPLFEDMKAQLENVVPIMSSFTAFVQGDFAKAGQTLEETFGPEKALKIYNTFDQIVSGARWLVDSIKEFFRDLQPTFENLGRIIAVIGPMIGGAIAVIWGILSEVIPPILNFITGIAAAIVEWEGFIPIVAGLAAGFLAFKATTLIIAGVTKAMQIFQTVMWAVRNAAFLLRYGMLLLNTAFLANPIAWVVGLIVGLIAMFVVLYKRNEEFRALVDRVWAAIKNAFASVIEWATTTLPAWWESLKTGFFNMIESIVGFFASMGARIMAFLQPFITFFVQSWENLKLLVLGIIQVFISLITGNFEGLKLGLLAIWTAIKNQALAWWTLMKDTVIQLVVNLWNGAVNLFQSGKDKVLNFIKNTVDGVVNGFREAKDNAIQRVKDMWNGIVQWVGKIPGKFQEMKDNVIQKVKSIDLMQIGKDIVQGLIDGIGSMISSVGKKAREIAGKVESAIKERLGIESPARATIELGYETGTGFIIGINDTMAAAVRKATELGSNVAKAISSTTKNAMDNVWDGIFQFTAQDPLSKYFTAIREDGDWLNDWAAYLPEKMKNSVINLGKSIAPMLEGLKNWSFEEFMQNYINAILVDGDYMNDWITHLPRNMRDQIMAFGKDFAQFEGVTQAQFRAQQTGNVEEHTHYWQVNAEEITDVASLIDVVNGIVQTVRSR